MQFEGGTISNFFTLEFAPTLDGPWTNWGSISSASVTGTVMSLPTPFFYRIVQTASNAFPPYATGTPVYVESDSAALQVLADLESSIEATYQPAGNYATGTPIYIESDPSWSAASQSVLYAWSEITNPVADSVARAGVAAVGAVASNALPASATIGWEVGSHAGFSTGLFTVAVAQVSTLFTGEGETLPATFHNRGGYMLLERDYAGMFGSNAASLLGYDMAYQGGAALWLQSAWASAITNYAPTTIYFARGGTNFTSENVAWSLSARPSSGIHDANNQFALFEAAATGNGGGVHRRVGVYPGGSVVVVHGPTGAGEPETYAGLTVRDTAGTSAIAVVGTYISPSTGFGELHLGAGGEVRTRLRTGGAAMSFSIDQRNPSGTNTALTIDATGRVRVARLTATNLTAQTLTLGTNAAVSNWPAGGGGTVTGLMFNGIAADVSGGNAVLSYPPPSRIVAENYVVQARDYAIGADTAADDVEVTLPAMGSDFTSVFIRKFSGANALTIWSGAVLMDTLSADGDSRAYDWWPTRTNWYRRN